MSSDPTSQPGPAAAPPVPAAQATASISDATATQGGPADEYALTPELVEEEAIRGDFMLRWAVILLALLLGCTVVSDTLTLVRIRSGEYMAGHGVLPPRVDVFSTAAEGREWVNLGWLGDLILAGVYQIGGEYGLTILAALLAAVTFHCVVLTSMSGVSTWWGSIVAMLGAVACFPHLTPNSIWTLLGVAITCRLLQRFDDDPAKPSLWALVPCFWLWANLDRHAFVGLAILLLWGIGRTATNFGLQAPKRVALSRIWAPIGAVCLAVMIHPWHYHVWTSPWLALGVEFPEIRQYGSVTDEFAWQWFPMVSREFWVYQDLFILFAFSTAGLALVSMVLNLKEVPFEHLLMFFGINGLAVAGGYFVPAAAIVNVVIASINSQAWYRRSFSQEYSVNALSLAYSRGGRALTVLAVFGMAYLAITGWLMGAAGRRIGTGFDQDLASNISSYQQAMSDGPADIEKRPFNFRLEQGDVLIWVGYKPFVDRRVTLFALGDENLLDLHRQTRTAINPSGSGGDPQELRDAWRKTFADYSLNLAVPRLTGVMPDYGTFVSMLLQPQDWYPASLAAATATFYCLTDDTEPAILAFVEDRQGMDPLKDAFSASSDELSDTKLDWPLEPTFSDKYLLLPNPAIPNGIQLARHYDALLHVEPERVPDPGMRLAMAYLAMRHARIGLSENPNIAEGWRILSRSYLEVFSQESLILSNLGTAASLPMRLHQSIGALQLATVCEPDQPLDEFRLASLLSQIQRHDLAVEHFRRFEALTGRLTMLSEDDPDYEQIVSNTNDYLKRNSESIATLEQNVAEGITDGMSRVEMAVRLQETGFPAMAMRTLEADLTEVESHPGNRTAWGSLLMQNGRIEQAWMELERVAPAFSDLNAIPPERMPTFVAWANYTAIANLLGGDADRAIELWSTSSRPPLRQALSTAIIMAPLADRQAEAHGLWGSFRSNLLMQVALQGTEQWVGQQWLAASAEIEAQKIDQAAERLKRILERQPQTGFRPLIAVYLTLLTDEEVYIVPDVELPIWGGMFADDPPAQSNETPPMASDEEPATDDGGATDDAAIESDTEPADTESTDDADSSDATPEESADEDAATDESVQTDEAETSAGDAPTVDAVDEAPGDDSPSEPLSDDDIE